MKDIDRQIFRSLIRLKYVTICYDMLRGLNCYSKLGVGSDFHRFTSHAKTISYYFCSGKSFFLLQKHRIQVKELKNEVIV